jgi:hypothetical protein
VRTFSEFQHHIQLHRERVVKLGIALAKSHFPHLNLRQVETFLWLHDHSKTLNTAAKLKAFNYEHPQMPAHRLFEFYGRTPETQADTLKLISIVNDINAIDEEVSSNFFKLNRDLSWGTQDDFFTIEKVADLVDRSLDPMAAEEFGHPMILASSYVQDAYLATLSMWLESQFEQITKDLRFSSELCYSLAK